MIGSRKLICKFGKAALIAVLAGITAVILAACGNSAGGTDGQTASKNDGSTEQVSAADTSEENNKVWTGKTAVLFSSLAEIWKEAGGDIDITVGETVERGFAASGVALVDDGAGKTVNTELLLSLEPELVICSADIPAQVEAAQVVQKAGIKTLVLHVESFSDYLDALERMTEITGNSGAYNKGLELKSRIDEIISDPSLTAAKQPKILFVRAGSTDSSTKAKDASDHFACAMLEELGCVNIISEAPLLAEGLNTEAVLAADPDFIFFSLMGNETAARDHVGELIGTDAWQQLTAVKEGRTFILPKELFHFKPCSRWGEAYEYLADLLTGKTSNE